MSKFDKAQTEIIQMEAARLGLEPEVLLAFIDVESAGVIYAEVDGAKVPLIRFEGHYFDRLVPAAKQGYARREGLASPRAQAIKNSRSQKKRYAVLDRAKAIDNDAAIMSHSWGIGQVMGEHWDWLGYESPNLFEDVAMRGFDGQLELMVRFIEKSGIVPHLQRKDWSAAARIYNGKNFRKFKYHIKLRNRYAYYTGDPAPATSGMLRAGSKGAKVRQLQQHLIRAGHPIEIDGDFGPATERAVVAFQKAKRIDADGIVGPMTSQALNTYKRSDDGDGAPEIKDVPEVRTAVKTTAPIALGAALKDEIAELATKIGGLETEMASQISEYLMVGASAVGVALAAYAVLGWVRSKATELGIEDVT